MERSRLSAKLSYANTLHLISSHLPYKHDKDNHNARKNYMNLYVNPIKTGIEIDRRAHVISPQV